MPLSHRIRRRLQLTIAQIERMEPATVTDSRFKKRAVQDLRNMLAAIDNGHRVRSILSPSVSHTMTDMRAPPVLLGPDGKPDDYPGTPPDSCKKVINPPAAYLASVGRGAWGWFAWHALKAARSNPAWPAMSDAAKAKLVQNMAIDLELQNPQEGTF